MTPKNLPLVVDRLADPGTGVTVLSAVIDGVEAHFDAGALHGLSVIEAGIAFDDDQPATPGARLIFIVWTGVRAGPDGADGYYSAVASPLRVDETTGTGWRPPTHFTDIILAIRGMVRVDDLSVEQKNGLRDALRRHDSAMWDRRSISLRDIWPD